MIFKEIEFPLTGPLRQPLLIMEWIIFFLFLELAIIFLVRVIRKEKALKNLQEKAYIFLFLGNSFMWMLILIGEFYVDSVHVRLLLSNLGYLVQMTGALFFIFYIEKYKTLIKKKLFTFIFTSMVIIFIFISFLAVEYTIVMSFTFWPVFSLFFIFYINKLNSDFYKKKGFRSFNSDILKFILGFFFIVLGFGLTTTLMINLFGLGIRILGDIFQIIAIILFGLFFISVPSFSEIDWQKRIDNVLIMHKSGRLIYKKSFRTENIHANESLIAGVMTSLEMMLERVTHEKNMLIIEKKGKIIITQSGKLIYGVLICDENIKSLQILLNNFIEQIELIYSKVLETWDGDLKVFIPINDIANDIFL